MSVLPAVRRRRTRGGAFGLVLLAAGAMLAGGTTAPAAAAAVPQQIAADPFTNADSQHATAVEPDSFAVGDTIVAAYQLGRFSDGGASGIGFATSTDGGTTWRSGTLPRLTASSTPAGVYERASDPSVAYDAAHGVWLVSSLVVMGPCSSGLCQRSGLVVSRSADGLAWSDPVVISPLAWTFSHDKNWTVCDNGAASRWRGRCYTSYSDFSDGRRIVTVSSDDGGLTWSAKTGSMDPLATGLGVQPVVQPNGTLVVVFLAGSGENAIGAISSTDGGASFGPMSKVADVARYRFPLLRGRALPTVGIDRNGVVYAAWDDCSFRTTCTANDIVLSTSSNGTSWSAVSRIPIDDVASGVNHVVPGLAVDDSTSGAETRLALTYFFFPRASCDLASCELRVGSIVSRTAGASWEAAVELTAAPMSLSWLPSTTQGRMVGDYISPSFVGAGVAVAVFPLARAAPSPALDQPIVASRIAVALPPPPPAPPAPVPAPAPPVPAPAPATAPPLPAPPETLPTPLSVTIPAHPARLTLLRSSVRALPRRPLPGRPFTLRFRVRTGAGGPRLAGAQALCTARIGSSRLRTLRNTFAKGMVTCSWRIPPTALGKHVLTLIGASLGPRAVRSSFSFPVARPGSRHSTGG